MPSVIKQISPVVPGDTIVVDNGITKVKEINFTRNFRHKLCRNSTVIHLIELPTIVNTSFNQYVKKVPAIVQATIEDIKN